MYNNEYLKHLEVGFYFFCILLMVPCFLLWLVIFVWWTLSGFKRLFERDFLMPWNKVPFFKKCINLPLPGTWGKSFPVLPVLNDFGQWVIPHNAGTCFTTSQRQVLFPTFLIFLFPPSVQYNRSLLAIFCK